MSYKIFPRLDLAKYFVPENFLVFWHTSSFTSFFNMIFLYTYVTRCIIWFMSLPFHVVSKFFFPRASGRPGEIWNLSPLEQFPPPCIDNYMLPLMGNTSVALCTYTAKLFMYIVSMIGMSGEIQFVCFIVYNNKHINCFSLLIEGKDPVRCWYIYNNSKELGSRLNLGYKKTFLSFLIAHLSK